MNKSISIIILGIALTGCTTYPYEQKIRKFYTENAKLSIRIEDVLIDSAVSDEQAKPHIEKKFIKLKERLKNTYKENYEKARTGNKPRDIVMRAKERLDSANNGLFSDSEYEIRYFKDFLATKYRYEQVRLRYKLSSVSTTETQIFVSKISDRDTTLQMTDRDLKDYLTH